jgi:peroxiredoxin
MLYSQQSPLHSSYFQNKKSSTLLCSVVILGALIGLIGPTQWTPLSLTSTAMAAPLITPAKRAMVNDFELKDLKGKLVRLSDYKGQVVLVNFWATWCAPCKQEIPHLNRMLKSYKDQGFTVLAISTDSPQTLSQVGRLARRWAVTTLLDPEGQVVATLNPRGVAPYTLFVDRQGRMALDHDGYHSGDEVKMEEAVKALLTETKDPRKER